MRRVLACLAAASAIVFAPSPDASAAPGASAYGRGGFAGGAAFRSPVNRFGSGRGALGFNRPGNGSRFGRLSRLGYGSRFGYGYGSRFGYGYGGYGRGDVQQNVFVGGESDGEAERFDRFPITATTGIAPSPTPEPVIYVINSAAFDRGAKRPGARASRFGADGTAEPSATGIRAVAVTVPRGR